MKKTVVVAQAHGGNGLELHILEVESLEGYELQCGAYKGRKACMWKDCMVANLRRSPPSICEGMFLGCRLVVMQMRCVATAHFVSRQVNRLHAQHQRAWSALQHHDFGHTR